MPRLSPGSVVEAERLILEAWRTGRRLRINPDDEVDDVTSLCLGGLDQIVELNAADGVATVEAGTRVGDIDFAARQVGLWCPPLRHVPSDRSIGAVVAGARGWRTRRYGGIADYLLGSHFVCPAVGPVRHGGLAIKNAAGYNLTALLVGSRGVFGVILLLNLRLVPVPPARVVRCYEAPAATTLGHAATLAARPVGIGQRDLRLDGVDGRVRPGAPIGELRVEISDYSEAALTDRLAALDVTARQVGARCVEHVEWSDRPARVRVTAAFLPERLPSAVQHVMTRSADAVEIRFEATGGGLEVWTNGEDSSDAALPAPTPASLAFRDALRQAFDPNGLLQLPP